MKSNEHSDSSPPPRPTLPRSLPSWAINLCGFSLLIALVLIALSYQLKATNNNLQQNALARSTMVATIIEEHLANATLANETIDIVITSLLLDKARFVEYLDSIEPLHEDELEALARETGLTGISLIRHSGLTISGPQAWFSEELSCNESGETLRYDETRHLGYLVLVGQNEQSDIACLLLGLDASHIITLHNKTSLPTLLASLSSLPGVHSVQLEQEAGAVFSGSADVQILEQQGQVLAETRLASSQGTLVVRLNAENYTRNRDRLRSQFFLFAALLFLLGLFFSWLLYRYQMGALQRTRNFERIIAREHEAASLGRATATIAHEVRNPLNAINMGLQRLTIESVNLDNEQRALISAMQEAVNRTSSTVRALQRFTRPLKAEYTSLHLDHLVQQSLTLYEQSCIKQGIRLETDLAASTSFYGDKGLLAELVENLLTNAIEAQPDGGFLRVTLTQQSNAMQLTITNGGCTLNDGEIARLGEPYFTTKTRGSGLGLALCRRIAEAHGGNMGILPDTMNQTFTIDVLLPLNPLNEETMP